MVNGPRLGTDFKSRDCDCWPFTRIYILPPNTANSCLTLFFENLL